MSCLLQYVLCVSKRQQRLNNLPLSLSLTIDLKMAASRIQIASNKKSALLKQNKREIAQLLADDPPREEKARIKAEALIRDDNLIEAYEILQLECELLYERIKLIEFSKKCPSDLVSVVSTLMWAAHRVDIPELLVIRQQFRAKYGKIFEEAALRNDDDVLNERVVRKLSVEPPEAYLVQTYLERICQEFDVEWEPKYRLTADQIAKPTVAPVGYSVPAGRGTGLGEVPVAVPSQSNNDDEKHVLPPPAPAYVPPPTDDFAEVDIYVPPSAPSADPTDNEKNHTSQLSYADLAARFDQLKK